MRRSDREVTDPEEIRRIIEGCDVCRIALNGDDGFPYIIPLNFGIHWAENKLTLYFHSATEGRKHNLIAADPRASFEMDSAHELVSLQEKGYCTMNYECVMGHGTIEYVTDENEKLEALSLMTDRYHTSHFEFNHAAIPRTSVYKLSVESLTAKRKQTKLPSRKN